MAGPHHSAQKKRQKTSKSKQKKKSKKQGKKGSKYGLDGEEYDSDLDLERKLKPIGGYIKDRDNMIEHMFKCIQGPKLKGMLPDILKPLTTDDLKRLCLEQLEIMSKKRIRKVLEGADPQAISSSGTEEESSDEAGSGEENTKGKTESHAADSTSHTEVDSQQAQASGVTHEDNLEQAESIAVDDEQQEYDSVDGEEYLETPPDTDEYPSDDEEVIDEEMQESEAEDDDGEEEMETEEDGDDLNQSLDEGELEEGEVREPVVKRKQSQGTKGGKKVKTKHTEVEDKEEHVDSDKRQIVTSDPAMESQPSTSKEPEEVEENTEGYNAEGDVDTDDESDDGIDVDLNYKVVARERKTTDGQSGISTTQMEILELEMRARAIKAMLKATEIKEKRVRMVEKHKLTVKNTTEIVTKPKLKPVPSVQSNEAQGRKIIMSSKQSQVEAPKNVDRRIVKKSPVSSTTVHVKNNASNSQNVANASKPLAGTSQKQVVKKPVTTKASPTSTTDSKSTVSQTSEKDNKTNTNSEKSVTTEPPSSGPSTSGDPNKKPLRRKLIRK